MQYNILFKFKGAHNSKFALTNDKIDFFVEIFYAQIMPVNIAIYLLFSYSLDSSNYDLVPTHKA